MLAACQLGSLVAVEVGVAQVFLADDRNRRGVVELAPWAAMVSSRMLCPIWNPTNPSTGAATRSIATATLPAVAESVE